MKIQIVDRNVYVETKPYTYTAEQTIHATRGEIEDVKGTPIVKNKLGFNVTIEKASFPSDNSKANAVILQIAELLTKEGYTYYDSLPVSVTAPFEYTIDEEDPDIYKLKKNIGVNLYPTAENCMNKLCINYDISDEYSDEQKRIIAGIRYEMLLRDFSTGGKMQPHVPTLSLAVSYPQMM